MRHTPNATPNPAQINCHPQRTGAKRRAILAAARTGVPQVSLLRPGRALNLPRPNKIFMALGGAKRHALTAVAFPHLRIPIALLCMGTALFAQQRTLPEAPPPQLIAQEASPPQPSPTPSGIKLTLADAESIAIQHNPEVSIAHLVQLAQAQVVREARSAELPAAIANLTAVDSHANSRITAGALNNPDEFVIWKKAYLARHERKGQ